MTPNQITVMRVMIGFIAVGLLSSARGWFGAAAGLAGVALIIAAIALDAVDGYVTRRKGLSTPLGARLDILGDRVLENLFFTYFAVSGLISLWVPVIFFVRGTATDFLRGLAATEGREGFGQNSMHETWWGHTLVTSRASRAAYAALKCVCFCWLGLQMALQTLPAASSVASQWIFAMVLAGQVLVTLTLAFCLVRAVPVLWEGRRFLRPLVAPQASRTFPAGVPSR